MNEQLVLFEGNEVKVKTNKGETLINLVHTAKCCGLTKKNKNGKNIVNWKSGNSNVFKKLTTISRGGTNVPPQYIEEIKYILDEIENTDDRNSIYMSSWLSRRMAMECNNDKAMQYKDFLATLDESYSKGELTVNQSQLTTLVSSTMNNILPTMIESITKQFAPMLIETKNIVDTQKKDNEKAQENLERLIGIRSRNTQTIGKKLTARESEFYGRRIYGSSIEHKLNRYKLLNHFDVQALEDIQARKFDDVLNYVNTMKLIPVKEINKYKMSTRNKNSYKYEVNN
ncbi:hypothetical protein [Clostridium sp. ZBS18]|uniref:hypothetical protein n=1 Tax=Clostridium sp. ZBS18 TaxID=2949967 RepID=UPI00207B0A98|nr:hypothetical protein [Clostridium sp. ZBS18]